MKTIYKNISSFFVSISFVSLSFVSLMLLLTMSSTTVAADLSGFWMVKFEREPSGQALFDAIPEEAVFINDAGAGELGEGDYSGLVLSDSAKEEVANYDFAREFDRENTCVDPSVAFYMQAPFPIEIHQSSEFIVFKMEYYDMFRMIFMDGRKIPDNAPHTKSGYSVGHWEGDDLVVITEKISSATFMNNGFDHSDNLKMTERFRVSDDGQILWMIQMYEDPEVFSGTAARYMAWGKQEGEFVYPYECDPSFGN